MLWNWFTNNPSIGITEENREKKIPELVDHLNQKYGDFEYAKDARALDTSRQFEGLFRKIVERARTEETLRSILVAGVNSGAELDLVSGYKVTALDLSDAALKQLSAAHPDVSIVQGDMQNLPFAHKSFDLYVSMRSIHASNLVIEKALEESLRVTKFFLLYSVANGYNLQGELVKGMY